MDRSTTTFAGSLVGHKTLKIMVEGTVLYPGCGHEHVPFWFTGKETRLDIDATCEPDIVASITDMGDIGEFDNIYTSHTLEHLYQFDVPLALAEFLRVLKPGGAAIIVVPDLEGVNCDDVVLYESLAGPICGRDLFYGLTEYVKMSPFYAHHTGFVKETLQEAMTKAGFLEVSITRMKDHSLMGVGKKPKEQK